MAHGDLVQVADVESGSIPFRRIRRLVRITAGVLLTLVVGGALYQALSARRDARRFPPPGRMIDVGGRRLHLVCLGRGEPIVIFEPSGFGSALSSEEARKEVAARTRACSYDRAGSGWSDARPGVVSAGLLADDLRLLLERADLPGPYILVPASIGGFTGTCSRPASIGSLRRSPPSGTRCSSASRSARREARGVWYPAATT